VPLHVDKQLRETERRRRVDRNQSLGPRRFNEALEVGQVRMARSGDAVQADTVARELSLELSRRWLAQIVRPKAPHADGSVEASS
jgi:hypothetical protein